MTTSENALPKLPKMIIDGRFKTCRDPERAEMPRVCECISKGEGIATLSAKILLSKILSSSMYYSA